MIAPGAARGGDLRNYVLVTGAYWADTLADGASRILVLFYFYDLGYSPFEVASLFLFYEVFGIVTNLVGGWLAARLGLKATLFMGLGVQIVALTMLGLAPAAWLVVPYVMAAQALSGIAKDLTKMSSKSAVKLVVPAGPEGSESALYRWVAILTGSKNALKGVGFFLGGLLLTVTGFQTAMLILAAMVATALVVTAALMHGGLGRADAQGEVPPHLLQQPGGQRPRRRAGVPVRVARRLVRGRAARLPAHGARLELLGGRDLPGDLGDRLRHRPGVGAASDPPGGGGGGGARAGRPDRDAARVRAGAVSGRDRGGAGGGSRSDDDPRGRPDRLRRHLRASTPPSTRT